MRAAVWALFGNKNREVSSTAARIKEKRRVFMCAGGGTCGENLGSLPLRRECTCTRPTETLSYPYNTRTPPPTALENHKQKSKRRHEFRKLCRKLTLFTLSALIFFLTRVHCCTSPILSLMRNNGVCDPLLCPLHSKLHTLLRSF